MKVRAILEFDLEDESGDPVKDRHAYACAAEATDAALRTRLMAAGFLSADTLIGDHRVNVIVVDGAIDPPDLADLMALHGGTWGEHPDHPAAAWMGEVANGDTRSGYWRWVAGELEAAAAELMAPPQQQGNLPSASAYGADAPRSYLVDYPLRVFFDCSTAHLSPSTCDYLTTAAARSKTHPLTWTAETPFGWFVWAEEAPDDDIPADLAAIMRHARAQGAEYILFDSDAAETADFPILRQD